MSRSEQQSPGPCEQSEEFLPSRQPGWLLVAKACADPFSGLFAPLDLPSALFQVELGAPGFPPQLLSSFIKQQPLVIARLASFLGS